MKKNLLWAALSMTAALLMTACSDGNDTTEEPVAPPAPTKTIIPYSVTVSSGANDTRAYVESDNRTLKFDYGDQLYITGTNIQGVLTSDVNTVLSTSCTFYGELTYTGRGTPADDLQLTATLVSYRQRNNNLFTVDEAGAVTINYPTTSYCTTINDAVEQYSMLTGTSTFGAKSFTLTQHTAILNFEIKCEDSTPLNTTLSVVVSNGGTVLCTADVTPPNSMWYDVKYKFVLPVPAGTTLDNATVTLGDKTPISFGASQTLTGKVYNVKKTQGVSLQMLCPDNNHPHAIDLGLPSGTKWACCNVGAFAPDQYGSYFAWGEIEPDTPYQTDWSNYLWSYGGNSGTTDYPYFCHLTRYCSSSGMGQDGFTDGLTELIPENDAATANWGGGWRMPTYDQIVELNTSDYVKYSWASMNGKEGQLLTSKSNGKCIFLPFTLKSANDQSETYGYYWSSTRQDNWSTNAWNIYINFDYSTWNNANYRYHTHSVRPVVKVTQ